MSTVAHFSLAEYDQMIALGAFGPTRRRLELIQGEIREMNPIGPIHEVIVDQLVEWSFQYLPKKLAWVRVQNSVGLPELDCAPEPDIAWVVRRDYSQARPTPVDVLLIIEVAESSLSYDRGEKADLYATAGISDYWLVNLVDRTLEIRREPVDGQYSQLRTLRGEESVSPLAAVEISLSPDRLFRFE